MASSYDKFNRQAQIARLTSPPAFGSQTMPDPLQKNALRSFGKSPAVRANESLHKREMEYQQHRMEREANALLMAPRHGAGLIVGAPPIVRTQDLFRVPTDYTTVDTRPKPSVVTRRTEAKPASKANTDAGIIIYGRSAFGGNAPILVIKTKLITKQVYTKLEAGLRAFIPDGRVVRKQGYGTIDPSLETVSEAAVIDLSEYDYLQPILRRTRNLDEMPSIPDAYMINIGIDGAIWKGRGVGLQIVIIVKGPDQGIYIYTPARANLNWGLSISAGASAGPVFFNRNNKKKAPLRANTFSGNSQGWSAGYGHSLGVVTSYTDGEMHEVAGLKLLDLFADEDVLYRAVLISHSSMAVNLPSALSTGFKAGFLYSFSKSDLPEWGIFPFNQ